MPRFDGGQHVGVACFSVLDVVVDEAFRDGDHRSVAGKDEVRLERFQSFKLGDVFGHVAGVRRDEDGADAGQHVAGDQPGFAEKADVARVMARRDEDGPRL